MTKIEPPGPSSSEEWTLEDHRRGKHPAVVALFDRFLAVARSRGTVQVVPHRKGVVLRRPRRILAGLCITDRGRRGHLNLSRQVIDPRFTKIEPLTKRLYFPCFFISSATELDDDFLRWLREACQAESGEQVPPTGLAPDHRTS